MDTLYWVFEFVKVTLCYLFILFIWPSVIFRKYLKNKSKMFRFSFCATTQVVLINTVVLMLGLIHLLNPWTINILFYGTLLFSIRKSLVPPETFWRDLRKLALGTLSLRQFFAIRWSNFMKRFRKLCGKLWQQVRPYLLEYILLTAIVVYGVIYFSYTPIVDHSYGFGDMYTHHSWIYGLIQGKIFSAGVYPEGMHCVVYLMHTVSGLPVFNCNLFLGCIHVAVYLLSAYFLMREIFRWRGTPLLVLTFFLIFAASSLDLMISLARLQRTLPGEYGMYAQFLCALFLIRFLKQDFEKGWYKDVKSWIRNEDLLVFCMALAATIAIHFYATIIAFFMCVPIAIVYIRRLFSRLRILPLAAAVICGTLIAVIPMGGALLSGIPFQGSIGWALNIMNGVEEEEELWEDLTPDESQEAEAPKPDLEENAPGQQGVVGTSKKPSFKERVANTWNSFREKLSIVYKNGYGGMLGSTYAFWIVRLSLAVAAFCLLYRLICIIPPLRKAAGAFDNYLPTIGGTLFLVVMYAAPMLGIPELIAYIRLPSTAYIMMVMVAAMPIDIVFSGLQIFTPKWILQVAAMACMAAICVATVKTENYHGYFYNELTRYRSVVDVTNSIIHSFPQNSYTIVASTDELYSVIQYGRHEELLKFLQTIERGKSYYLPTEYVFVYVEKKPIIHAQYHYSSGPKWLASDIYADSFTPGGRPSKYPEIFASQITEEAEERSIKGYSLEYNTYRDPDSRTVINAKADKWCRNFDELYDFEMKTYYEDEDFVCYYFQQNTYSLYDLTIWN